VTYRCRRWLGVEPFATTFKTRIRPGLPRVRAFHTSLATGSDMGIFS
jgi:hypothetical protein